MHKDFEDFPNNVLRMKCPEFIIDCNDIIYSNIFMFICMYIYGFIYLSIYLSINEISGEICLKMELHIAYN